MKANTPLNLVLPSLAATLLLGSAALAAPDSKADASTTSQKESAKKDAAEKEKEKDKKTSAETATGKVFSVDPTLLSVATEGNPTPIQFRYNAETPYVDEDGKAVPMDLIRPELPVTVEYATEGETLTARRIVVTRATLVGDGDKSPEKARAELADSKTRGDSKSVQTDSAPQTLMGTVATVEQTIAITPRGETSPRSIVVNNSTRYVNAAGQPVSSALIFSGMPVTIRSMKDGERHIAMEVVVRGDSSLSQSGMQGGATGAGGQSGQGQGGQGSSTGTTGGGTSNSTTSRTGSGNGTLTDGFIQPITNPGLLGNGQNQQGVPGNMNNGQAGNGQASNGQAGQPGQPGQQPGQANNFNPANGGNQNNPNQAANNTNGTATNPNGTVNPGNNRTNAPQQNQGTGNNSNTGNNNSGNRTGTPSNQPNPDNRPSPSGGSNNSSGGGTATPSAGPASGGGGGGGGSGGASGGSGGGGASGGSPAPSR